MIHDVVKRSLIDVTKGVIDLFAYSELLVYRLFLMKVSYLKAALYKASVKHQYGFVHVSVHRNSGLSGWQGVI